MSTMLFGILKMYHIVSPRNLVSVSGRCCLPEQIDKINVALVVRCLIHLEQAEAEQ